MTYAAPIGNPYAPAILEQGIVVPDTSWCQPKVSFSQDWILLQEFIGGDLNQSSLNGTSQIFSFSWSILERCDLSMFLGTGQNSYQTVFSGQALEGKSKGGLVWYGQGKLVLLEIFDTGANVFGQAGGWDWMDGPFSLNGLPFSNNSNLKMRFWEVGGAISQKIGPFIPYAGAFVCHSSWKFLFSGLQTTYLEERHPLGAVFGCSLSRGKMISLNLEWRNWSENSFTLSGEIRF